MALRLRIVSEHATRLGQHATKVFSVHGGTIGRAADNEWILPDPERYLSGKHARVDFRAGNYILVDTSSNGTYINGAQVPLGKYHDYVLRDGDYIRIGEYELLVSIDKTNDFPTDNSAIVAYDGEGQQSSAIRKSTANDLGADLDLSVLLESSDVTEPDPDSGIRPHNAYGQSLGAAREEAPAEASSTPWHMLTRPLKVDSKVVEPSPPPPPRSQQPASSPGLYDDDFDAGMTAFCRGAGIDPRNIGNEARSTALQLAGQLLRESILGLMDLNQSRKDLRTRFRIAGQQDEAPESPLNFSKGVDEALVRLLTNPSKRAGSIDAIRSNFRELKAQNVAFVVAMRAAVEEFIGRLDPKELEERFERASKRGVFGTQSKARYWELFAEMYPGFTQRPAEGFPHVIQEAFAKAFEAKLRTLVPPRRSGFGADPDKDQAVGDQ
jgi:type VI secretion system protein